MGFIENHPFLSWLVADWFMTSIKRNNSKEVAEVSYLAGKKDGLEQCLSVLGDLFYNLDLSDEDELKLKLARDKIKEDLEAIKIDIAIKCPVKN